MTAIQLEDLGLCEKGAAPGFIRRHTFTTDGGFPINTSGGQLSVGLAGYAAGFSGRVEAIWQLTGRNLAKPVPEARFGLAVCYYMITYDRGRYSAAAILSSSHA